MMGLAQFWDVRYEWLCIHLAAVLGLCGSESRKAFLTKKQTASKTAQPSVRVLGIYPSVGSKS